MLVKEPPILYPDPCHLEGMIKPGISKWGKNASASFTVDLNLDVTILLPFFQGAFMNKLTDLWNMSLPRL